MQTTQDLYYAFLDGIKKSYTGIVIPSLWNRIMNDWAQIEWLKLNVSTDEGVELTQKQEDDLDILRVATDGVDTFNGAVIHPIAPDIPGNNTFTLPRYGIVNINNYNLQTGIVNIQSYPEYLRKTNISFKLNYVDNECELTGISDWIGAQVMRTDQRNIFMKSPYRKPKDDRLYYEMLHGKIRLITGTASYGVAMRMEYLRKPRRIFFDELHPADAANPNYIPGIGSVNCEFDLDQKKEIIDIAVRAFLERVQDPRYQTFMNERQIKLNTNV